MENVKETIKKVIGEIQEQQSHSVNNMNDESRIVKDLGFSSLDIAQLIASLEIELGVDPFAESVSIMDVHSINDLYTVYSKEIDKQNVTDGASI